MVDERDRNGGQPRSAYVLPARQPGWRPQGRLDLAGRHPGLLLVRSAYNLLELYDAGGALSEIYVHIASPAQVVHGELHYTDYELDVACRTGERPIVLDEDEFEQVVTALGLTSEFRAACYRTIDEVTALIEGWVPRGIPWRPSSTLLRDEDDLRAPDSGLE